MPRGSAPGERRGGKSAGTPNKATLLKQLQRETLLEGLGTGEAKRIIQQMAAEVLVRNPAPSQDSRGTPLAKDVLEKIMLLAMGLVGKYQPREDKPAGETSEAKMLEWLPFALGAAKELAKYQSPTFKAVAIQEVPPAPEARPGDGAKVVGSMGKRSQQDAANVYMRLIRNDPKAA